MTVGDGRGGDVERVDRDVALVGRARSPSRRRGPPRRCRSKRMKSPASRVWVPASSGTTSPPSPCDLQHHRAGRRAPRSEPKSKKTSYSSPVSSTRVKVMPPPAIEVELAGAQQARNSSGRVIEPVNGSSETCSPTSTVTSSPMAESDDRAGRAGAAAASSTPNSHEYDRSADAALAEGTVEGGREEGSAPDETGAGDGAGDAGHGCSLGRGARTPVGPSRTLPHAGRAPVRGVRELATTGVGGAPVPRHRGVRAAATCRRRRRRRTSSRASRPCRRPGSRAAPARAPARC